MKIGFELEKFYLVNKSVAVVPQSIPHDDCGWLVEYRGQPFYDPYEAVGSLVAEMERVKTLLPEGASTSDAPYMNVPRAVKLSARRLYTKGVLKFRNLYGKNPSHRDHAGLHISFTSPLSIRNKEDRTVVVNQLWDFSQAFRTLDTIYAKEIKTAKRVPGFYEIKPDLRIEYRSLPANVDLWELAANLKKILASV